MRCRWWTPPSSDRRRRPFLCPHADGQLPGQPFGRLGDRAGRRRGARRGRAGGGGSGRCRALLPGLRASRRARPGAGAAGGARAGLPDHVEATTVNKMCGSGMMAAMMAADAIAAGSADIIVAGGMESMSNAPYLSRSTGPAARIGHDTVYDHMMLDGSRTPMSPARRWACSPRRRLKTISSPARRRTPMRSNRSPARRRRRRRERSTGRSSRSR